MLKYNVLVVNVCRTTRSEITSRWLTVSEGKNADSDAGAAVYLIYNDAAQWHNHASIAGEWFQDIK